jgi:hypothetical protein
MSTIRKRYRIDGIDEYTIEYRQQPNGTFKIFAMECPYDPFGNSASVHHRYGSGENCVAAGKEPQDIERATALASLWMKRYSQYVRTGVFNNSGARIDV